MSNEIQKSDAQFVLAQREAKALCASSLVPESFRGNVANTLIAMDMANRLGASPMAVMQNLYIVHGRPAWSAQFMIASLNKSGTFTPLRYDTRGDDPHAPDFRVRAVAKDRETGDVCEGPWITWRMVKSEGWDSKKGSKWQSIPDLMFRYRAAAFWVRLYSPETTMGIHTVDEVEDFAAPRAVERATLPKVADANALLSVAKDAPKQVVEPEVDFDDVQFEPEAAPEAGPDYENMSLEDLFASVAGKFGADPDSVLESCCSSISSKATSVAKLSVDEGYKARAWCLNELGVVL